MAFLDDYSDTESIDIGRGYWIEIKTCLSQTELEASDKHLQKVRGEMAEDGKMQTIVTPDTASYRFERVCASIVAWNMDEEDGRVWPLEPDVVKRHNIRRLPGKVFKKVLARVTAVNEEDPEERRDFRDATGGVAADGDARAAGPAEVPGGEPTVGAPGNFSATAD